MAQISWHFFSFLGQLASQWQTLNASAAVVPRLRQYTLKEVAFHCTAGDCWMVIMDFVYDLTEFIDFHPAGREIMLEYAGSDATSVFNEKPHSIEAASMLDKYIVGQLVKVSML